ncbi:MAG: hypothetical protein ACP5PW_09160 [Candidatus Dormibacteria bacterium]
MAARVISWAALIMASVLVDASVIRLMVFPAEMFPLGRASWWLPTWLDRLHHPGEDRAGPQPQVVGARRAPSHPPG